MGTECFLVSVATPDWKWCFVGRSRRGTRKMGPSGLTEKRERYVQLMQQGHLNSEACRILEIYRNTGDRWLNGRKGVGAMSRQMLYPPRVVVPVRTMSERYLSEEERVFIADRLLGRASLRSIAREPGRSPSTISPELARNPPGTGRYHPSGPRKPHYGGLHGRGCRSSWQTGNFTTSWSNGSHGDGVPSRFAAPLKTGFRTSPGAIWRTRRSIERSTV